MSENPLPTTTTSTTRQALAIEGRSQRNKVTGKLKAALESMVWEGLKRDQAATKAGLADSSLRFALRKPHVLVWLRGEQAALRASVHARNIHRLDGIADNSKNDMARVQAIKAIEQVTEQADATNRPGGQALPGLVIVINGGTAPKVIPMPTTPQIEGESVRIEPQQA